MSQFKFSGLASVNVERQLNELIHIAHVYQLTMLSKLEEMKQQLNSGLLNVAVVGQMKRGKSTLINAILEQELLPTGVVPVTSIITELQYDNQPSATLIYNDGLIEKILLSELEKYVSETQNPKNQKGIKKVHVKYPSELLKKGIRLYDTPGLGSFFKHNTFTTKQFLSEIDVVLFIFATDTPLNETELTLLDELSFYQTHVLFILNKIDMVNQEELQSLLDFSQKVICTYIQTEEISIIPICAQQALQAKTMQNDDLWKTSGLEILIEDLHARLVSKKEGVLEKSLRRRLKQLANRMVNALELQRQALLTPYEQLEANTRDFSIFVEESSRVLRENEHLLDGEIKRLLTDFDDQARVLVKKSTPLIKQALEKSYANCRRKESKEVKTELQSMFTQNIRQVLEPFRNELDNNFKVQFNQSAKRFLSRLEKLLVAIYAEAAELFGLKWQGTVDIPALQAQKSIDIILGSGPRFYETSPSAYAGRLPSFILNPLIFREIRLRVTQDLDKNCGLIRQYYLHKMRETARQLKYLQRDLVQEARDEIQKQLLDALEKKKQSEYEVQKEVNRLSKDIEQIYYLLG